jgi:hypothetical protein
MKFEQLAGKVSSNFVASAPYLFTPRQEFTSTLSKIELFTKIIDVPGVIIECGVQKGNSLILWHLLSSVKEPYNVGRRVIGFDTFEGFPSVSPHDGDWSPGYLGDGDLDILIESANLHEMNSATPGLKKIQTIKGDATIEIPKFIEREKSSLAISLLYLDFDLYEPTLIGLQNLYQYVVTGGIIAFDELFQKKWPGETKAFNEFFQSKPKLYKSEHDPHLTYFVKD